MYTVYSVYSLYKQYNIMTKFQIYIQYLETILPSLSLFYHLYSFNILQINVLPISLPV